jgi:monoamine oxidase
MHLFCFPSKQELPIDYDVAIIGGGITGLYTAYTLQNRCPEKKTVICEKNNHLGGRIITKRYENFVIEYGPFRFETGVQSKLMRLFFELGIEIERAEDSSYSHKKPDFTKLTKEEYKVCCEALQSKVPPTVKLIVLALKKILKDQWDFQVFPLQDEEMELRKTILKEHGKYKGKYLYEYGILDLFEKVLSKEAVDFIIKGNFYYMLDKNPNAAEHLCILLDLVDSYRWDFVHVKEGVQHVIERLHEKVDKFVDIRCNRELKAVCEVGKECYRLFFNNNESFTARHIVMTVPPNCLQSIDGISSKVTHLLADNLISVELIKIFVVVENPPWSNNKAVILPEIPCREIFTYLDKTSNEGMILFYGDSELKNYWFSYNEMHIPEQEKNKLLTDKIHEVFKYLFPDHTDYKIKVIELTDWSANNVSQHGVYLWKPGVKALEVIDNFYSMALGKSKYKGIHICGETFSEYQAFIEGALRSSDKVSDIIESHG